jgi:phosphoribosylanthranilate isomerase
MKQNYIGITGFTEKKQILNTLDYINLIESEKNYMFGFLVSKKTLSFEEIKNKRYLNFKSFKELKDLMDLSSNRPNIINMIHFNTNNKEFSKELIPLLKELGTSVEAIQFNLSFINLEEYKILRKEFPKLKLLFQLNNTILENYSSSEIYSTLKEINFEYLLIDLSGGNGTGLEPKHLINFYNEFDLNHLKINIGIAGGLSGDNVKRIMEILNEYNIDYFIDAESKLRDKLSDTYGDDIWNQNKVNSYILNSNINHGIFSKYYYLER